MITWPQALVAELAERRCIVIMGAGASMGSVAADGVTHPPNWENLLNRSLHLIRRPTDRKFAKSLIAERQYLDAAELITECSDHADFGTYIRSVFVVPKFKPSPIHEVVLEVDPKIVVTTNYDTIYDLYCTNGTAVNGYNICRYYDTHAVDAIRSTVRLVLKAHGCVSDPTKIVLGRSSYFKARRDYPGFYAILDALFLTHTLLFIGCSLTDPDIQLVLENVNISAPSAYPHYALVEKTRHSAIAQAIRSAHNIQLIEYPKGQHANAVDALTMLKQEVESYRALPS